MPVTGTNTSLYGLRVRNIEFKDRYNQTRI